MIIFQTKNSVLRYPKNQKCQCENNLLLQWMEEKSFKLKRMYKRYVNFSSNFFIFMKFSIAAYLKIYPMTFFILLLAICSQGCNSNHGSCVAPNRCRCSSGWTGSTCDDGTMYLHSMHVLLLPTFSSSSFPSYSWAHIILINHIVLQPVSICLKTGSTLENEILCRPYP